MGRLRDAIAEADGRVRHYAQALANDGLVGPYEDGMSRSEFDELVNGVATGADLTVARKMFNAAATWYPQSARHVNAGQLCLAIEQQLALQQERAARRGSDPWPQYPRPPSYYNPQPQYPQPPRHHHHPHHERRWGPPQAPSWKNMSGEERAQAVAGGLATFLNAMQQLQQQQQYQSQW